MAALSVSPPCQQLMYVGLRSGLENGRAAIVERVAPTLSAAATDTPSSALFGR